jgi:YD repeat-containing protein
MIALAAALCLLPLADAVAQVRPDTTRSPQPRVLGRPTAPGGRALPANPVPRPVGAQAGTPHYDVVLEVPELSVDSIGLRVANLRAHLALDANAANLVVLTAGVDASIERVELEITGVLAEAYLYVDLDNVALIVNRVLATLNHNPQILTQVLSTVDTVVNTVGGVANTVVQPGGVASQAVGVVGSTLDNVTGPGGLLSQTVNTLGQTVQVTLDAAGTLVERTLDTAGGVVGTRTLGSITSLPVLRETPGREGQVVRRVRHASGALIEYTVDQAGRVVSSRVLQPAPQPARP